MKYFVVFYINDKMVSSEELSFYKKADAYFDDEFVISRFKNKDDANPITINLAKQVLKNYESADNLTFKDSERKGKSSIVTCPKCGHRELKGAEKCYDCHLEFLPIELEIIKRNNDDIHMFVELFYLVSQLLIYFLSFLLISTQIQIVEEAFLMDYYLRASFTREFTNFIVMCFFLGAFFMTIAQLVLLILRSKEHGGRKKIQKIKLGIEAGLVAILFVSIVEISNQTYYVVPSQLNMAEILLAINLVLSIAYLIYMIKRPLKTVESKIDKYKVIIASVIGAVLFIPISGVGVSYGVTPLHQFTYKLVGNNINNQHLSLERYIGSERNVVIPSSVNMIPVKEIQATSFSMAPYIETLTVPNTVISIYPGTLRVCKDIKKIVVPLCHNVSDLFYDSSYKPPIPESLKEIELTNTSSITKNTFYNCKDVETITFNDKVTFIEKDAFKDCESLKTINFKGSLKSWSKIELGNEYSNPMSQAQVFNVLDENNKYVEVKNIELDESITEIGDYQFYGFENIESVKLTTSIKRIGKKAFGKCSSLKTFTSLEGDVEIDGSAFALASKDIATLDGNAYYMGTKANPHLILLAAKDTGITSCAVHNDTKYISDYAFLNCASLKDLFIYSDLEYVGENAFENCRKLQLNEIKDVYYLGTEFNPYYMIVKTNSRQFTSYQLHEDTKLILPYVFKGVRFDELVINAGIKNIERYAFYSAVVDKLTIKGAIEKIEVDAFYECCNKVYFDGTIEEWCNIHFENEHSSPLSGAISFNILNDNNQYEVAKNISIPNTITEIRTFQFKLISTLEKIYIPKSVTKIEENSFGYFRKLKIYCEADEKQTDWHNNWNSGNNEVVWGAKDF